MDYKHDLAVAEAAKDRSSNASNPVVKKGLFAPASPASSSNISPSTGTRKPSLRPLETGEYFYFYFYFYLTFLLIHIVPIYDGRKRQLKIPDELRNIPAILSRYPGDIPYHSLVLVAYTVSLYRAAQGSRKDQPIIPLNISFAVVLEDEVLDFQDSQGGEDAEDGEVAGEDGSDEEAKKMSND